MKKQPVTSALLTAILVFFSLAGSGFAEEKKLASGTWSKKSHAISGKWEIIDYGTKVKIKLHHFDTKKAPDLKIFFHPKTISEVSSKNATSGSKLLAKLSSHTGYQEYDLPAGFKLSDYKSVIIHCEKYSKLWGGADL